MKGECVLCAPTHARRERRNGWRGCGGLPVVLLSQFNQLDLDDRTKHVSEHATYITSDLVTRSNFFAIDDFFVEVRSNPKAAVGLSITPFDSGPRYRQMLHLISLMPKMN
ncbi:MAG: hypothetical protein ABI432_13585 [Flavobacteriales bacterium]